MKGFQLAGGNCTNKLVAYKDSPDVVSLLKHGNMISSLASAPHVKQTKEDNRFHREFRHQHVYKETNQLDFALSENIPNVLSIDIVPKSFFEDVREIAFSDACGKLYPRV